MFYDISDFNIDELLSKPLWQLSGREFCALTQFAHSLNAGATQPAQQRHLCHGVNALAQYLGCSESKVYALRRDGVLNEALVSRIGKRIVFDGDRARELANENPVK